MDFIFGCWSDARSGVDCRVVNDQLKKFYDDRGVPAIVVFSTPNFSAGIASRMRDVRMSGDGTAISGDTFLVADARLFDEAGAAPGSAITLNDLARAVGSPTRLAAINGDFAAAAYDVRQKRLILARDISGAVPLHYSARSGALAFSSLVPPLLDVPWASRELDEVALATYLITFAPGLERTVYKSIKALMPASRIEFDGLTEDVRQSKYWLPAPAAHLPRIRDIDDAYEALHAELVRAVKVRVRRFSNMGIELSGGLDSSTVAGVACTHFPDRTFDAVASVLADGDAVGIADERAFIAAMGARYPNLPVTYETAAGRDLLSGANEAAEWLGMPHPDPFYYMTAALEESTAARGSRCVMTGDGGDYCISLQPGSAVLVDAIRHVRPELAIREFRRLQKSYGWSAKKMLRSEVLPNLLPLSWRRAWYADRRTDWGAKFNLNPALAADAELLHHAELCDLADIFHPTRGLAEMERDYLKGLDVRDHAPSLCLAAISPSRLDYCQPLFDRRVIETCMALPVEYKVTRTHDRAAIRGAGGRYLPDLIRCRTDKGNFSPDYMLRCRRALSRMRGMIEEASEHDVFRRVVDVQRVRTQLDQAASQSTSPNASDDELPAYMPAAYLAHFLLPASSRE